MKLTHDMAQMLKSHMEKHIEVALEAAVYVLRYPTNMLLIQVYANIPKMTLYCQHHDGYKEVLFTIELKEHPLYAKRINTYFGGPLEDFVKYIDM